MENQIARSITKKRKSVLSLFVQEKVHRNGYFKPEPIFIILKDQGKLLNWVKIQLTELFCQIIYTIAPEIITGWGIGFRRLYRRNLLDGYLTDE